MPTKVSTAGDGTDFHMHAAAGPSVICFVSNLPLSYQPWNLISYTLSAVSRLSDVTTAVTPQSGNRVSTSLGNIGLCWTVFARNRDTAVPADRNGDLQTLICVLVARPRRCLTLSNPVPWQYWMAAYLGYTLQMKTLFRGWPVVVHETHTRRRRRLLLSCYEQSLA